MTSRRPTRLSDPSFEPSDSQFDTLARKAQTVAATRKAGADRRFLERVRMEVRNALARVAARAHS
jgi:hypothetical protein